MAPPRLPDKDVYAQVKSLNDRYQHLRGRIEEVHETQLALCDILVETGACSLQGVLARLHRRRFEAVCHAHGAHWNCTLPVVLNHGLISPGLVELAGLHGGMALRASSRKLAKLVLGFPGQLCICQAISDGTRSAETLLSKTWPSMPVAMDAPTQDRAGTLLAVIEGHIYTCGGRHGLRAVANVERFGLAGHWEILPEMTCPRWAAAGCALANSLFICGGRDGLHDHCSAELFNPSRHQWELLPPMSQARWASVADVLNGVVYVCGGREGREDLSCVEAFSPASALWATLRPMAQKRWAGSSAVLQERLFVCGGRRGWQAISACEALDPEVGVWSCIAPMHHTRWNALQLVHAGAMYVFGGRSGAVGKRVCERYDLAHGSWTVAPPMARGRWGGLAVSSGRTIHLCGGAQGTEDVLSWEQYDPHAGSWKSLGGCVEQPAGPLWQPAAVTGRGDGMPEFGSCASRCSRRHVEGQAPAARLPTTRSSRPDRPAPARRERWHDI